MREIAFESHLAHLVHAGTEGDCSEQVGSDVGKVEEVGEVGAQAVLPERPELR